MSAASRMFREWFEQNYQAGDEESADFTSEDLLDAFAAGFNYGFCAEWQTIAVVDIREQQQQERAAEALAALRKRLSGEDS